MRIAVEDLRVNHVRSGRPIVDEVSFGVAAGRVLSIVGESGSGKTTVALALLGHARSGSAIVGGEVTLETEAGRESIVASSAERLRRLRGDAIVYVGQDPASSFDPGKRLRSQAREVLERHGTPRAEADARIKQYLERVALNSEVILDRYPFQVSGGQLQRVLLAMAFASHPSVIVLDEPTTSLDVLVQREVLDVVRELRRDQAPAIIHISHDVAVVSSIADEIAVMYAGRIVEHAAAHSILGASRHPYTRRLLAAVPELSGPRRLVGIPGHAAGVTDRPTGCSFAPRCELAVAACRSTDPRVSEVADGHTLRCIRWDAADAAESVTVGPDDYLPLLDDAPSVLIVEHLCAWYGRWRQSAQLVVDDVSLHIAQGESLGIVGESGSGKTTLARCIVGLHARWRGTVSLRDMALERSARDRPRVACQKVQIVFQNPHSSFNPRVSVAGTLGHVVNTLGTPEDRRDPRARSAELLDLLRLPASMLRRFPRELSGGEKQRVAIARAIAARPDVLVCDEITSALDVSVQAAIIELLGELRRKVEALAVVFISHDLAAVRAVADRIAVMRSGALVEEGGATQVLEAPQSTYTRALLAAVPRLSRG